MCHFMCYDKEVTKLKETMQILYKVCSKYEIYMSKDAYYAARNQCKLILGDDPMFINTNKLDIEKYFKSKFEVYFK